MVLPRLLLAAAAASSLLAERASAKDAFVFLGATGDNALRPNGVWRGVFEAFASGTFDKVGGVDIHVAMNTPHTADELHTKVLSSLAPFYDGLKETRGWKCNTKEGNCTPARFMQDISVNIWPGRDAGAQAANMTPSLAPYERVTVYLSVPPFVFGSWSKAAIDHWGEGAKHRVHVACEKPFGAGLADADVLHEGIIGAGVPEANLHIVDHWLSFFMNRNLMKLRALVEPRLLAGGHLRWGAEAVEKVVVTEFETRGLNGRGGFFDGVGQVRDMVQSHLLQVLALALAPTDATDVTAAKLAVLNRTNVSACKLGQYDGFLLEPKLKYHPAFADATLSEVMLTVDSDEWRGVPIVIATGKDMGAQLYTVDFYQKGGQGVLTFEIGKEETGLGGVRVKDWPLLDSSPFDAPAPGFGSQGSVRMTPEVHAGTGYILNYSDPSLYFPKPYALMASSLLTRDYGAAFVSYPECRSSWIIVTASSPDVCLDPPPGQVKVYKPPDACGHGAPSVCWQSTTVEDVYNNTFKCTPEHDKLYANVSLYHYKCKPPPSGLTIVV